ncbi:MAG: AIR carboxylase family protein [Candidatus Bathyarchaeota archaeon]|nr:MAG: AIR carboxylase family protein [Candidatus Bathyarchaeota archaeon]
MKVHILAGSKSDEEIIGKIVQTLKENKINFKLDYASAHREPERVKEIVKKSKAYVFIAVAGLSAALPGFVSSLTKKPVIGVPVNSKNSALSGLDALLSIVQMPKGVPVACVGINAAENAALLAERIIKTTKEQANQEDDGNIW